MLVVLLVDDFALIRSLDPLDEALAEQFVRGSVANEFCHLELPVRDPVVVDGVESAGFGVSLFRRSECFKK